MAERDWEESARFWQAKADKNEADAQKWRTLTSDKDYAPAVKVIQENPLLAQRPDGITYAVRAADLTIRSRDIDNTRSENAKLKADIEKLQNKLSIGSGSPTTPASAAKGYDSMSQSERATELLKRAQQLDRDSGYGE